MKIMILFLVVASFATGCGSVSKELDVTKYEIIEDVRIVREI